MCKIHAAVNWFHKRNIPFPFSLSQTDHLFKGRLAFAMLAESGLFAYVQGCKRV